MQQPDKYEASNFFLQCLFLGYSYLREFWLQRRTFNAGVRIWSKKESVAVLNIECLYQNCKHSEKKQDEKCLSGVHEFPLTNSIKDRSTNAVLTLKSKKKRGGRENITFSDIQGPTGSLGCI
jgi:hypothetical protein